MDILDAIDRHLEENQADSRRPHLGASVIGNPCDRAVWYSFRWAKQSKHQARLLRLFDRGHKEEDRIVGWLRAAGFKVSELDKDGLQYRVSEFNDVFGGSLDGIIEHKGQNKLLEFKTHNKKSFDLLEKKGVTEHKPEHVQQMQVYMHLSPQIKKRLSSAIYIAVCKDDDRMYVEEVAYSADDAKAILSRAKHIINSSEPPSRLSDNPTFYKCKWCDYADVCHFDSIPEVNCRTCVYFEASNGFMCNKYDYAPTADEQRKGCKKHLYNPSLIPLEQVDVEGDNVVYDGDFKNGPDGLSSKEIYKFGLEKDAELVNILSKTGGKVVDDV